MKTKATAILMVVALAVVMMAPMAGAMDVTTAPQSTITVNATGTVTIQPDMATVSVGVSTDDSDAKEAQKSNNEAAEKLITALKDFGLTDEQISTENYSLYPNYDYSKSKPTITSYTASHQLSVMVTDINTVGDVINTAVDAGANQSYGITFGVQDYGTQYQEALKLAVQAAQPKAEAIAGAASKQLGDMVSIMESGYGYNPAGNARMYSEATAMDMGSMPVQSGTLDVTASISVVYAMQ